ncbi:hypothetical protein MUK42_10220 [Musa troglodytarum]|uniref:Uncharacterized protein n=1 Tax=Musa troglodytarum TaxID=320322 RepID=A0A9E7EFC4_9LILI|nr:hypothetical protein MUK42_10220 [Musa troglodytarum]
MKVFQKVDNIGILVDLMVRGSERARKNTTNVLMNMVKSDEDKTMGYTREVDEVKVTVRALVDNEMSVARGKSKTNALLRVLESERRSQL